MNACLEQHSPPSGRYRVLSEDFSTRLQTLNRVARELRAMGYRTVAERVGDGQDAPSVEVSPLGECAEHPLRLGGYMVTDHPGEEGRVCSVHYHGVRVIWREAARQKAGSR